MHNVACCIQCTKCTWYWKQLLLPLPLTWPPLLLLLLLMEIHWNFSGKSDKSRQLWLPQTNLPVISFHALWPWGRFFITQFKGMCMLWISRILERQLVIKRTILALVYRYLLFCGGVGLGTGKKHYCSVTVGLISYIIFILSVKCNCMYNTLNMAFFK